MKKYAMVFLALGCVLVPAIPSEAQVRVSLEAYEAFRGNDATMVPDAEESAPGLLVTPNIDLGGNDPREARLVFKALPAGSFGWTRHIRFSSPGKLEFRLSNESQPEWVPHTPEVQIPGPIEQDFVRDVAMHHPEDWGDLTSLDVDYVVKDRHGRDVGVDRVRLLKPVVMAIGDSMTYGFQRGRTPPKGHNSSWSPGANWNSYPGDSSWLDLDSPWNVVAHKSDPDYQGFRGYLGAGLLGFDWQGEDTKGHGPRHMGYNGAHIGRIMSRAPQAVIATSPCYAIVIYWAGLNDVVGGKSASTMYGDWQSGVQQLLNVRNGRGKTLLIGVTLPKISSGYHLYTSDKQSQLTSLNSRIRSYSISAPNTRYRVANVENVPHNSDDDGLHFLSRGYGSVGNIILASIREGLR